MKSYQTPTISEARGARISPARRRFLASCSVHMTSVSSSVSLVSVTGEATSELSKVYPGGAVVIANLISVEASTSPWTLELPQVTGNFDVSTRVRMPAPTTGKPYSMRGPLRYLCPAGLPGQIRQHIRECFSARFAVRRLDVFFRGM